MENFSNIPKGISNSEKEPDKFEEINNDVLTGKEFVEKYGEKAVDKIYSWYKKAMERKLLSHGRVALKKENFIDHFFGEYFHNKRNETEEEDIDNYYEYYGDEEYFVYGDLKRGFLLGVMKHGVFIPSHFAPRNIVKGYELIKDLGNSKEIPAALAVTSDLVAMLQRISGWKIADFGFETNFRDNKVNKRIAYNNHPKIKNLLMNLLEEYTEEQAQMQSNKDPNKKIKVDPIPETPEPPIQKIRRKPAAPADPDDEFWNSAT